MPTPPRYVRYCIEFEVSLLHFLLGFAVFIPSSRISRQDGTQSPASVTPESRRVESQNPSPHSFELMQNSLSGNAWKRQSFNPNL